MWHLVLRRWTLTAFAVLGSVATPAFADHSFMLVPGIPGESTSDRYRDWIDLTGFGQEFTRRICGGTTVTKRLDRASALLAVAAANGEVLSQVTIAVTKPGEDRIEFLRLLLSDVVVAEVSLANSDPTAEVVESVRLMPRSVTLTYRQQDERGALGPPQTTVITCNRRGDGR
jgi:type VI secretion system secreted protein Hcp